jgi:outer membrane protein
MRFIPGAATFALMISGLAGVAGAQQSSLKIAFVNSQLLMDAAPGRAAATELLNKEGQSYQVQLQKMQDSINNLLTKYQKAEPTLSTAAKDAQQKAIQGLETEFQAKQLQFQKQFDDRTKEVMAPITDQVKKVIDDIRVEDGYTLILDNAPGAGNIVSADKNLDITDRVISRLHATPAAKGATPAPAPKPGASATPAGVGRPPGKPPTQ